MYIINACIVQSLMILILILKCPLSLQLQLNIIKHPCLWCPQVYYISYSIMLVNVVFSV